MRLIYDSPDIRVYHQPGTGARRWITFTAAHDLEGPFADRYVTKRGEEACFVVITWTSVYQIPNIWEALQAADAAMPRDGRIAYGSSGGAFAAAAFAKRLNIEHAIVAAPLVSVHPDIVGHFDHRWDAFSSKLHYMQADARDGFNGRRTVLYDPLHTLESQHAAMMQPHQAIHVPFSGHGIMYALHEARTLPSLINAIVDDQPTAPILSEYARCRRNLNHTRLARAEHLESRGRWKAAGDLYQRAAPASPAFAWFRSSICLSQWGDRPGAADAADVAAHYEPGYAEHARTLRMAV